MDECSIIDVQVADEMLEFWCNLVGALSASSIKEVEDRFRPYIDRLVICLCHLCKFDASEVRLPVIKLLHVSHLYHDDHYFSVILACYS